VAERDASSPIDPTRVSEGGTVRAESGVSAAGAGAGSAGRAPMEEGARDGRLGATVEGRYRVLRKLGDGGMGSVYEAEHLGLRQRVALKFLHAHLATDGAVVTRFLNEARAAAALAHPHIARALDVGRAEDGVPYIALELLEGSDLAREIERCGPLPVPVAVRVARQAGEALAEAHARGIVHRDVKPENVFLARTVVPVSSSGGRPSRQPETTRVAKVLDFGIARVRGELGTGPGTREGAVLGTPAYMPPEQLDDATRVDARTDVYALGAVLYTALAGRPPFEAPSFAKLVLRVATGRPEPLAAMRPDVPAGLVAVVERAMARDPGARFADMHALLDALAPFDDGGPLVLADLAGGAGAGAGRAAAAGEGGPGGAARAATEGNTIDTAGASPGAGIVNDTDPLARTALAAPSAPVRAHASPRGSGAGGGSAAMEGGSGAGVQPGDGLAGRPRAALRVGALGLAALLVVGLGALGLRAALLAPPGGPGGDAGEGGTTTGRGRGGSGGGSGSGGSGGAVADGEDVLAFAGAAGSAADGTAPAWAPDSPRVPAAPVAPAATLAQVAQQAEDADEGAGASGGTGATGIAFETYPRPPANGRAGAARRGAAGTMPGHGGRGTAVAAADTAVARSPAAAVSGVAGSAPPVASVVLPGASPPPGAALGGGSTAGAPPVVGAAAPRAEGPGATGPGAAAAGAGTAAGGSAQGAGAAAAGGPGAAARPQAARFVPVARVVRTGSGAQVHTQMITACWPVTAPQRAVAPRQVTVALGLGQRSVLVEPRTGEFMGFAMCVATRCGTGGCAHGFGQASIVDVVLELSVEEQPASP
jgi:tRNA A-37 threonylcarbamoyl transferase component Bud32